MRNYTNLLFSITLVFTAGLTNGWAEMGAQNFTIGSKVATEDGKIGTVVDVLPDKKVKLKVQGILDLVDYDRDSVASTNPKHCRDELCPGDLVATEDGYEGKVYGITPKGSVLVRSSGKYLLNSYSSSQIGLKKSYACYDHLCPDHTVTTSDGKTGRIIAITPNRVALVKFSGQFRLDPWNTHELQLKREKRCIEIEDCLDELRNLSKVEAKYKLQDERMSSFESKNSFDYQESVKKGTYGDWFGTDSSVAE